jgi:hypothetical protein
MKRLLNDMFAGGVKGQVRRAAGRTGAKAVSKAISKTAGKTLARTAASPWLFASDAVEIATERIARHANYSDRTARNLSKGTGATTAIAVGAIVGGPAGAAAGAGLWALGEAIDWLFD